ncbi:MAG: ABC transporter permease [Lachnospiraceae bacterium]|nr:ABC transporter permease [uncultured Faecalicatena sp.]MDY5620545.1 ABC transporter permease [Lachnospiraceae bacterium]
MKSFKVELKKCKRSGVLELLPMIGILGALYALANFIIRKNTLLNLPLPPMVVLLTQLYGMIMVLNMFGIIVATTLTYNIEFRGNAIKKIYMLPFKTSSVFSSKFLILFVLLALCIVLQNSALAIIGNIYLPTGTFELSTLLKYTGYIFITSLPVLSFMLLISSRCENIWYSLGIGVAGFFSGMAMALSDTSIFLMNPFVLMMKPAVASNLNMDMNVIIIALIETVIFYVIGWAISKNRHYE